MKSSWSDGARVVACVVITALCSQSSAYAQASPLGSGKITYFQAGGGSSGIVSGTTAITGGADTQVCFNDAGVMSCGDAGLVYAKATDKLTAGIFRAGSGTDAAPSVAVGEDGTGFYLVAANDIGISLGGGQRWQIYNAGSNAIRGTSTWELEWTAAGSDVGSDTGYTRHAAGVMKATDGGSGIRDLQGGGTAVASAAALPLPTGRVFHVTGTTSVTSITSTNFQSGVVITLIFDGVLTFTDGGNLVLTANFVTSADDTITLVYDGTSWFEIARSAN